MELSCFYLSKDCNKEHCKCTWVAAVAPAGPESYYYVQGESQVGPVTLQELLVKLGRDEIPRDLLCAAPGDAEWRPLCELVRDQERTRLQREIEKLRSELDAWVNALAMLTQHQGKQ